MTPVVTGDESLAARRVAALDWLSRGRDVRLTAELCAEDRAWVQALADEVGYPDRQLVGDAFLKARRTLEQERAVPVRQAPARAVVQRQAPVRSIRETLPEHVASYTAPPTPTVAELARDVTVVLGMDSTAEGHDHEKACDRCAAVAGDCCGHCSGAMLERLDQEQLEESEAEIEAFEAKLALANSGTAAEIEAHEAAVEPHLHTFVEGRDPVGGFAHCQGCGTTWRSAPCEVCKVIVAAAHIARTGRARHTWHPETPRSAS